MSSQCRVHHDVPWLITAQNGSRKAHIAVAHDKMFVETTASLCPERASCRHRETRVSDTAVKQVRLFADAWSLLLHTTITREPVRLGERLDHRKCIQRTRRLLEPILVVEKDVRVHPGQRLKMIRHQGCRDVQQALLLHHDLILRGGDLLPAGQAGGLHWMIW